MEATVNSESNNTSSENGSYLLEFQKMSDANSLDSKSLEKDLWPF